MFLFLLKEARRIHLALESALILVASLKIQSRFDAFQTSCSRRVQLHWSCHRSLPFSAQFHLV